MRGSFWTNFEKEGAMTVLRECVLVSELEERLYKGAIRKCLAYEGKIITIGGKSYISMCDLLDRHARAAEGLDVIDRAVPLHLLYEEIPGITKRDALTMIAGSHRARIKGEILKRRHGVYVRLDEETASMLERMTAFCVKGIEDMAFAAKCALIGNLRVGFY